MHCEIHQLITHSHDAISKCFPMFVCDRVKYPISVSILQDIVYHRMTTYYQTSFVVVATSVTIKSDNGRFGKSAKARVFCSWLPFCSKAG